MELEIGNWNKKVLNIQKWIFFMVGGFDRGCDHHTTKSHRQVKLNVTSYYDIMVTWLWHYVVLLSIFLGIWKFGATSSYIKVGLDKYYYVSETSITRAV